MLVAGQLLTFDPPSASPTYHVKTNHYGRFLATRGRVGQTGNRWSWGGTYPHNTASHYYAGLGAVTRAAWATAAAGIQTERNATQIWHLSGVNLWLLTNANLKAIGQPPTDTAPGAPPFPIQGSGAVVTLSPLFPEVVATFNNGSGFAPDWYRYKIAHWVPSTSATPGLGRFHQFTHLDAAGPDVVDVSSLYSTRYGQPPPGTLMSTHVIAFLTTGEVANRYRFNDFPA